MSCVMLSSHLYLGLPCDLLVWGFQLNIFLTVLVSGILCTWPNQLIFTLGWPCIIYKYYCFFSNLIHFFLFTFMICYNFSLHVSDRLVHHQENQITLAASGTFPSFVVISCVAAGANCRVSTNGHARDNSEWGKGARCCKCNLILLMMDQPVRNM